MEELKLTIVEHLQELRKRLILSVVVVIAGMIICYLFIDKIIVYVMLPAKNLDFVYLTPPELFLAYVKVTAILGFCLTSPFVFWQIWLFLRPGLQKNEKRSILCAFLMGLFFFLIGVYFAYQVILPITLNFFVNMRTPEIQPMFSFGKYLSYFDSILLSFGLVFELPIVVIMLTKLRVISVKTLIKSRKIVVLLIFILAAFLTPPDVVSQILLAVPMLLLFELSIFFAKRVRQSNPNV